MASARSGVRSCITSTVSSFMRLLSSKMMEIVFSDFSLLPPVAEVS